MNSTKVVAITSWTKPGAVISSVRMQPPMRSLRSSTSTCAPLPAEQRRADQPVDAAADDDVIGLRSPRPPSLSLSAPAPARGSGCRCRSRIFSGAAIRIAPFGGSLSRLAEAREAVAVGLVHQVVRREGRIACRRPCRHRCRPSRVPQPTMPLPIRYSMQSTVGPGECGHVVSLAFRNSASLAVARVPVGAHHHPLARLIAPCLALPGLHAVGGEQKILVGRRLLAAVDDVDRARRTSCTGSVSVVPSA